jgi:hypothetical protein
VYVQLFRAGLRMIFADMDLIDYKPTANIMDGQILILA